jgi:hypothetical protein
MRNIEDDIYGLWSFLWNSEIVRSATLTGSDRVDHTDIHQSSSSG